MYNLVLKNLVYFLGFQWFGITLDFQIFSPRHVGSCVQRRNPIYDAAYLLTSPNFIESYLMGRIQDQSVSTYVFDSLSVLRLALSESHLLVIIAKISYQISWPISLAPTYEAIKCETSGKP
jgi:hypothetical protein